MALKLKKKSGGLGAAVAVAESKGAEPAKKRTPAKKPEEKGSPGLPRKKKRSAPPRLLVDLTDEQQRKLQKMVKAENTTIKDFVLWKLGLLDID